MIQISETRDIALCQELRRVVFILEQNVPLELEIDGLDDEARHLLVTHNGVPVGTARLLSDGDTGKIGRVCVLMGARGLGLGAALIRAAVAVFRSVPGVRCVKLGAQVHALGFYEALGFVAEGAIYDDAGIPHRDMVLPL